MQQYWISTGAILMQQLVRYYTGAVLTQCWSRTGTALEHYWNNAEVVLKQYWCSTAILEQYWNNTGTVLEHDWCSAGRVFEQYWCSTGVRQTRCAKPLAGMREAISEQISFLLTEWDTLST